MTRSLQHFGRQSSAVLREEPLDVALERISAALAILITDPEFVAFAFSEDDPPGKKELLHDPATGFYLFAHVQKAGKSGKPHSHGSSWAIYGNARSYTDMIEWARVNPEDEDRAVLRAAASYRVNIGETRAYGPGVIHSTAHPEQAWVLRMTGTNLDTIPRYHFSSKRDEILESA
ncbi:MAG: hypothetical protein Q7T73_09495 [Beijerinckiaceae bacterium]|jgi:hypothetical protein|nr:hypothetical protein [Beijerinckiaceae bacterium]